MTALTSVRTGLGPNTLVLLHGFLGSSRNVGALARRLAARDPSLSVFALDLTGHGESPPLPERADLGTLAGDVVDTIEKLGVPRDVQQEPVDDGGGQPGVAEVGAEGLATRRALRRARERVEDRRDLTVASCRRRRDVEQNNVRDRARLDQTGLQRDPAAQRVTGERQRRRADGLYRWRVDRAALARLHAAARVEDLWPAVEGRRTYTVRLIRGGLSRYVDERDAERLIANGCRVDTVADATHWLHVERPDEVAESMLARRGGHAP